MGQHQSQTEPGTPRRWGDVRGERVFRLALQSNTGELCEVSNYGASLLRFFAKDGHNFVLGYETLDDYLSDPFYLGSTVGRVANRIAGAGFEWGNKRVELPKNDGPHHLHGGFEGFSSRVWKLDGCSSRLARFSLRSRDGDEGYPGTIDVAVTYALEDHALSITMEALAQDDTLVNLAHHSYFNLEDDGDVLDHRLTLACSSFTPGAPQIPDGTVREVTGHPLDFRTARSLGERLPPAGSRDGSNDPGGYDHNLLVDGSGGYTAASSEETTVRQVAHLHAPRSGRSFTLWSNQPCVQLYTGNFLDGKRRGLRGTLEKHAGFCLETQAPPNAINVPTWRPMVVVPRGTRYHHKMAIELGRARRETPLFSATPSG